MIVRIISVVLLASSAFAVSFTAVANGDWQSTATWGTSGSGCHVAYPCMTDASNSGDTVNLSTRAVTCSTGETCSFGTSPAADLTACTGADLQGGTGAQLIVQNGATFIYAGPACIQSGTLNFQAGSRIFHDSSWATTPIGYSFTDRQTGSTTAVWCVGFTAGCTAAPVVGSPRVVWNGDSFYSPNRKSTACIAANSAGCVSNRLGGNTALGTNDGMITAYNLTLVNVGNASNNSWISNALSGQDDLFSGLAMYNSGPIKFITRGRNITVDKSFMGASIGNPCIVTTNSTATGGVVAFTNSWVECNFGYNVIGAVGLLKLTNVLCKLAWSAGALYTATSNYRLCMSQSGVGADTSIYDQVFLYIDSWNTGASETSTGLLTSLPMWLINSILWQNASFVTHYHRVQRNWGSIVPYTNGPWVTANNVNGTLGNVGPTSGASNEAGQVGLPQGGNAGGAVNAFSIAGFGNISVCGYNGRTSNPGLLFYPHIATTGNKIPAGGWNAYQNDHCSSISTLGAAANSDAGVQFELATANGIDPAIINATANIFYRNDTPLGVGAVPEILNGIANASFGTPGSQPANNINYNAVWNGRITDANVAPCGTSLNACAFAVNGPLPTTEFIVPATAPPFVDAARSIPLFSEYLNDSGLFPYSRYSVAQTIDHGYMQCTTNYRGAWVSGTSYAPCDVVYVDSTVTGYSAAYNGRRSYWICKIAHAASSANQPITAYDSASPFAANAPYWEDAWVPMWLKSQILAGTVFADGALPPLYNSPVMYAVGLVNAWVRQGYKTTDPRLWAGKCSNDNGATFVECGAMPLPALQHIPPAGVNF